MTTAHSAQSGDVWQWKHPVTDKAKSSRLLHAVGLGFLGVLCIGYVVVGAIVGSNAAPGSRFLAVLGLVLISLAVMGEMQTRQARSTNLRIDSNGILSFVDSDQITMVDLRTSSQPAINLRSRPTGPVWLIEAITPQGAWHRGIANTAGYHRLGKAEIEALRVELAKWSHWASRGQAQPHTSVHQALPNTGGHANPAPQANPAVPNSALPNSALPNSASSNPAAQSQRAYGSQGAPFHWTVPMKPNAGENRRKFRIGAAVVIAAVAASAAFSVASQGLFTIVLSMFFPFLMVLTAFGLDLAFRQGQGFVLKIEHGVLIVTNRDKVRATLPLNTVQSFKVDSRTTRSHSSQTTSSSTSWFIIPTANPEHGEIAIPGGFSVDFGRTQALELEATLQSYIS